MGGSGISLVYLQNSGLGNIVNPLLSLLDKEVYSIPMLLLIGWRGEPGLKDEPQHIKQGRVTPDMLNAMEVPWYILSPCDEDPTSIIQEAHNRAIEIGAPVALLVRKGFFDKYQIRTPKVDEFEMSRETAIHNILSLIPTSGIVISTTGMISREVFEYRVQCGVDHTRDFLTVGGMGHSSSIAMGVAMETTNRKVYCLDGDGALLMHLGALTLQSRCRLKNFIHIVLNNGAHDSVGGQQTVGLHVDLCAIAIASGYVNAMSVDTKTSLQSVLDKILDADGPSFVEVKVNCGSRPDLGRPSGTTIDNRDGFQSFCKGYEL